MGCRPKQNARGYGVWFKGHPWYEKPDTRKKMSESGKKRRDIEEVRARRIAWNAENPYDIGWIGELQREVCEIRDSKNLDIIIKGSSVEQLNALKAFLKKLPD